MRSIAATLAILAAVGTSLGQDADVPPQADAGLDSPAQSADDAPAQPQRPPMPTFIYTIGQSIEATTVPNIDGGGKANSALTRTEFDVIWLASRRTRAIFQFSNEFAFYDFDGAFRLDPVDGDPVGSMNRQNVDVLVSHNLHRQWSLIALGGSGLARERNADVGDSIVWRAGIGTAYQATENISIGVSVIATAEQEGNVEFLPLPAIDATFDLDESWTLSLGTLSGASLSYEANDKLSFELRAGYNERNYRLDEDGFAPEGVFQDKSIDLRLGVNWQPQPGLEIEAGIGSELWRRFKIEDSNGNRLRRVESDPTLVLFAGLSYRF